MDVVNDDNEGIWKECIIQGPTPGQRYGHSLSYMNPYFVLFGGNFNPNLTNEIWIINTKINPSDWRRVQVESNISPCPRLYHTCELCENGTYDRMMIIYGGRDSNDKPLNDIWELSRRRDGSWIWIKGEIIPKDYLFKQQFHNYH